MTKVVKLLLSRISADHRGLSMVLSKSYESKLHFIFQEQMIPARENVLLPAFYKSNHWKFYMTLLSQSTQNTNHWDKRLTRWTDVDLLKVCLYQSFGFEQTEHLYLVSFVSLKLIDVMSTLVWDSNVYINDWFTLRYVESNRKYQSLFSSQFSGILRQIFID